MKAEFHNTWRDVLVPERIMIRFTALCNSLKEHDGVTGVRARQLLQDVKLLPHYPNWHEVDDESHGKPTEGNQYLCTDEDGYTFIAEYGGKDDHGKQMWYTYRDFPQRVRPTYWCKLPHTPYDDLRDPLRDIRFE